MTSLPGILSASSKHTPLHPPSSMEGGRMQKDELGWDSIATSRNWLNYHMTATST